MPDSTDSRPLGQSGDWQTLANRCRHANMGYRDNTPGTLADVDFRLGQFETSLITDEMVDRACIRFWRENAHDKSLTLHEQSRRAMRLALEEVAGEIIEAFGANGEPRGRSRRS